MPAYTHNRWARGVCDTGNHASHPLDTSPLANFTGRGDIVGISDTGLGCLNFYWFAFSRLFLQGFFMAYELIGVLQFSLTLLSVFQFTNPFLQALT